MIIKSELQNIRVNSSIYLEIESQFKTHELNIIQKEINVLKQYPFLNEQIQVGGELLGNMLGVEDYNKVVLLSQYIDEMVSLYQTLTFDNEKKVIA